MQIEKKVIIATHVLNYGAPHALRDYLIKKKYNLLFIGLPFHDQKKNITEKYLSGSLVFKQTVSNKTGGVGSFFRDFYSVIRTVITQDQPYDVFVGVNNLNCFAGLILKKLGKVKRVIYYSIDFVPIRFPSQLINGIYHQIEIFCVLHADEVWNVSPRIAQGREKFLHLSQKKKLQKVVPIGIWMDQVKKNIHERKGHQVLFVGHLLAKQGIQEVLEAVPLIIKKIPDFHFVIVGGGDYANSLRRLAKRLQILRYVTFTGWVFDMDKLKIIMDGSSLGIATYRPEKEQLHNFTYYADPTKLKDYLSNGLPVILTDVPYNAHEIQKRACGLVVEYDKNKIAEAIVSLLINQKKLQKFRDNSLEYAREFDWNKIFNKTSI